MKKNSIFMILFILQILSDREFIYVKKKKKLKYFAISKNAIRLDILINIDYTFLCNDDDN